MSLRFRALAVVSLTSLLVTSEPGVTASARRLAPIPLEEISFDSVFGAEPSPDRTLVAFTLSDARLRQRGSGAWFLPSGLATAFSGNRLRVMDVASGRVDAVADDEAGRWASWAPSWSPDGKWLAFVSDRDGHPRIWRWERGTRRISRVSDAIVVDPTRRWILEHWRLLQWTPDGKQIVARLLPEGMTLEALAEQSSFVAAPVRHAADQSTATVYPRPEQTSRPGEKPVVLMRRHRHFLGDVALVDVASGGVTRLVRRAHAERYDLSPDGRHVALPDLNRLRIVDTRGHEVASDDSRLFMTPNTDLSWSPAGDFVWHLSDGRLRRVSVNGAVETASGEPAVRVLPEWSAVLGAWLVGDGNRVLRVAPGGAPQVIATIEGARFHGWLYADERRHALFSKAGVQKAWFRVETDPLKPTRLAEVDVSTGRVTLLATNTTTTHDGALAAASLMGTFVIYRFEDARHYPNFWLAAPGGAAAKPVTQAGAVFERYELGERRVVEWLSDDGERRRGVLVLPAGYQPGTRVPMIVWVYGGVESIASRVDSFSVQGRFDNFQIFATRGYAVFFPESAPRVGTPMLDLAKNILPGVSKVVEMGIADERRLGVMGHSYGGYTTLALLVQTPRFRAAIADASGTYNFTAAWGAGWDSGESGRNAYLEFAGQSRLGATPWEARERYIENSPFFYLDRVETPLLLVHGDVDPVPVLQSDQVYFALRRLGKPVEYARYANVGHGMTDPANQLDLWRRRIEWFERHLKTANAGASPHTESPQPRVERPEF